MPIDEDGVAVVECLACRKRYRYQAWRDWDGYCGWCRDYLGSVME